MADGKHLRKVARLLAFGNALSCFLDLMRVERRRPFHLDASGAMRFSVTTINFGMPRVATVLPGDSVAADAGRAAQRNVIAPRPLWYFIAQEQTDRFRPNPVIIERPFEGQLKRPYFAS